MVEVCFSSTGSNTIQGLFSATSCKTGDSTSVFTERRRSRCSLSSCACRSNFRLKDTSGLYGLLFSAGDIGVLVRTSSSVCVELSTYSGRGFGDWSDERPFILPEYPPTRLPFVLVDFRGRQASDDRFLSAECDIADEGEGSG